MICKKKQTTKTVLKGTLNNNITKCLLQIIDFVFNNYVNKQNRRKPLRNILRSHVI